MITAGKDARRLLATGAVLLLLGLTGCVGPSRTTEDYRHKATSTASAVQGQLAIAELVLDSDNRGQSTQTYSSILLAEVSDDASSMVSAFETVQPSSTDADALRQELLPILEATTSALDQARILARRGQVRYIDADTIKKLSDRLEDFVKKHDA